MHSVPLIKCILAFRGTNKHQIPRKKLKHWQEYPKHVVTLKNHNLLLQFYMNLIP